MGRSNELPDLRGGPFWATADGGQPKVRPIGIHMEKGGKVVFAGKPLLQNCRYGKRGA